jgi:multidrug efflux pump subunit AcrA (membrane-fusion protein)
MTDQTKTRFPAPLYAAAGAGDLAYQQLRKLPAVVNELSERAAASLRTYNEQANVKATQLRDKAATTDFDALRGNAASVATSLAQLAQERAVTAYTALVARGERVVGTGVVDAADVVNADIEATEVPKAVEAATPTPKPRKRAAKPASE